MKKVFLINKFCLLLLSTVILSCNDANNDVIKNAVYLTDAQTSDFKKVVVDEKGCNIPISARIGHAIFQDINVSFDNDSTILTDYNKKSGTNYKLLPKNYYSLASNSALIKAGSVGSEIVDLTIHGLDDKLSMDDKYAIPVTIRNIDGDVQVLESSKSMVILIDRVIITSVAKVKGQLSCKLEDKPLSSIGAWTFEFRCKMDALTRNNQTCFSAYPSEIYSRFGDVVIKPTQLQVKLQGGQPASQTHFAPNKWYHIAVSYDGSSVKFYIDGVLDVNIAAPKPGGTFDFDTFNFGSTSFSGLVSELRFWTVCRNESQIKNNMVAVNPNSDGLFGYWKMNEGEGTVIQDMTANKNNLELKNGSLSWVDGVRVPDIE